MVEAGSRAGGSLGYRERLCLRRKGEGKEERRKKGKIKEEKRGRTKKEKEERLGIEIWLDTK